MKGATQVDDPWKNRNLSLTVGLLSGPQACLVSLAGHEVHKSIKFLFSLAPKSPRKGRGNQRVRGFDK
jgi:hypothetical protein